MHIAITREVSSNLAGCELTHQSRAPIDVALARRQHDAYEERLEGSGYQVVRLAGSDELPDCVFIEDIAVVVPEVAVLTRPGAPSRRPERRAVRDAIAEYRPVIEMTAPATLDGGDVLRHDRRVYVGRSARTNAAGIEQLTTALTPFDYEVVPVGLEGCLHLKSGCSLVGPDLLLINPHWIDDRPLRGLEQIAVEPSEPSAANALLLGETVIVPEGFERTEARLRQRGLRVHPIPYSELQKAEGGVTCCSLLLG